MSLKSTAAVQRLHYFDLLRGAAILYIVAVRHLDDYAGSIYHNKIDDLATYSFLGLFVFISGYLLAINNKIDNRKDLFVFFIKRFLRIFPLYILTLFLFMLSDILTFKSMVMHITFLNIVLNKSAITVWFVSIICIFYLIYPLIIYKYSILKILFLSIIFYSIILSLNVHSKIFDLRLLLYFPLFIFGIITFKNKINDRFFNNKIFLSFSFLMFLLFSRFFSEQGFLIKILFMIFAIPCLLFLGNLASKVIPTSVYSKIAYASFCGYLLHRVIYHWMLYVYKPSNNVQTIIYLTLIGIPLLFAVSFCLQKLYDRLISNLVISKKLVFLNI